MTMSDVTKHAVLIPVSDEVLIDAQDMGDLFRHWVTATPEERAEMRRAAAAHRAEERAAAERVELTLDGLLDKLGFTREYATHLVQPYCSCGDSADGWDRCAHARDEGD